MSTGTQLGTEAIHQPGKHPYASGHRLALLLAFIALVVVAVITGVIWRFRPDPVTPSSEIAVVRRGDFVRTLRLSGTVEAVQFVSVSAPQLSGSAGTLVVTKLVKNGTVVRAGDLLVEFDRQGQIKEALDREAEYKDLLQQIVKKRADQTAQLAADKTELVAAEHAVQTARLDLRKNEVVSKIDAEKNRASLEQAKATLEQLQQTFQLKRRAAQADLRILEIQRDRASRAMQYARNNSEKVCVRAPLDGVVVLNTIWKMGQMGEVQEGDQVMPGTSFLRLVNTASMQVRVRANQTDAGLLRRGQATRISLDAYPNLSFAGKVEDIAPVGQASGLNDKVRYYVSVVSIAGSDPRLMPDLSAGVDVELERNRGVLVIPRDALIRTSEGWSVYRKSGDARQKVSVAVSALSDVEAVIESGVSEGMQLLRGPSDHEVRP